MVVVGQCDRVELVAVAQADDDLRAHRSSPVDQHVLAALCLVFQQAEVGRIATGREIDDREREIDKRPARRVLVGHEHRNGDGADGRGHERDADSGLEQVAADVANNGTIEAEEPDAGDGHQRRHRHRCKQSGPRVDDNAERPVHAYGAGAEPDDVDERRQPGFLPPRQADQALAKVVDCCRGRRSARCHGSYWTLQVRQRGPTKPSGDLNVALRY